MIPGQIYAGSILGLPGSWCSWCSSGETWRNVCEALAEASLSNIRYSNCCSELFFGLTKFSGGRLSDSLLLSRCCLGKHARGEPKTHKLQNEHNSPLPCVEKHRERGDWGVHSVPLGTIRLLALLSDPKNKQISMAILPAIRSSG